MSAAMSVPPGTLPAGALAAAVVAAELAVVPASFPCSNFQKLGPHTVTPNASRATTTMPDLRIQASSAGSEPACPYLRRAAEREFLLPLLSKLGGRRDQIAAKTTVIAPLGNLAHPDRALRESRRRGQCLTARCLGAAAARTTVTVTVAVADPAAFVAVRRYDGRLRRRHVDRSVREKVADRIDRHEINAAHAPLERRRTSGRDSRRSGRERKDVRHFDHVDRDLRERISCISDRGHRVRRRRGWKNVDRAARPPPDRCRCRSKRCASSRRTRTASPGSRRRYASGLARKLMIGRLVTVTVT